MQSNNTNNSSKICMVLDHYFPPDIRIEKEARSLVEEGYEVHLLCKGDNYETKIVDNIIVHSIILNRNDLKGRLFNAPSIINIFYILTWVINLIRLNNIYNYSLLHSHDLTTAFYTILVGKLSKIPVILDMHENFPEALKEYRSTKKDTLYDIIFRNIFLHKLLEKFSILNAYHVFVVVDIRRKQLVNQGYMPEKISVLTNAVDIKYMSKLALDEEIINKYNNIFTITYVGGLAPHRGINSLIKSVSILKNRITDFKILVVGGKGKNADTLKKLCKYYGIEDYIELVGWVDFSKVPSYIFTSNVCVVPHLKSGHTDSTVPHKIFQYMFYEKPVIVTNCIPLQKIVEDNNCGIVVKSGDHKSLATAITQLHDICYATKLGKNGKKASIEKYSWEIAELELFRIYEKACKC